MSFVTKIKTTKFGSGTGVKLWIQIRQDPDPQGSSDLKTVASVVKARAPLSTRENR